MREHIIRTVRPGDAPAICAIYNEYIENTVITFEEEPLSAEEMLRRIETVTGQGHPWLVCESGDRLLGYAYASTWKSRSAYRFTLESTVYLDRTCRGKGTGTALYTRLLEEIRKGDCHVVMGVIALPNEASTALHEKLGFRKAGHFHQVGYKKNSWIDVGNWELRL